MMERNSLLRIFTRLFALTIVLISFSCSRCFADLWSGSISYPTGINATNGWMSSDTTLAWTVTPEYGGDAYIDFYTYEYTFTVPEYSLSHFILQVSDYPDLKFDEVPGWPELEFVNDTLDPASLTASVGTYDGTGGSNPGIPGPVYALKFEGFDEGTTWTWSFDSWREPVWGDFYTKDGKHDGIDAYAYNNGFEFDPYFFDVIEQKFNYELYAYIATPDTTLVPVPAAFILGMLGLGTVGLKLRKYS